MESFVFCFLSVKFQKIGNCSKGQDHFKCYKIKALFSSGPSVLVMGTFVQEMLQSILCFVICPLNNSRFSQVIHDRITALYFFWLTRPSVLVMGTFLHGMLQKSSLFCNFFLYIPADF